MTPQLKEQLKKIAIGAAVAGVGATGTSALQGLAGVDFGEYAPYVAAALAVAANVARKLWPVTLKKLGLT